MIAIASDAVAAGLKAHGIKKKIAIMEPYYPCIEPRLNAVLGAHGYEVVRYCHMRGKSPASCEGLSAQDMIKAIRSIDGPDVEAIVAFGANLPLRQAGRRGRALARQAGAADQRDDLLARAADERDRRQGVGVWVAAGEVLRQLPSS